MAIVPAISAFWTPLLPVSGKLAAALALLPGWLGLLPALPPLPPLLELVLEDALLAQSALTFTLVLLLLLLLPDEALPLLVLPLLLLLPEPEFWELLLSTLTSLSQFTFVVFDWLVLTVLVDPGPVSSMLVAPATPSARVDPTTAAETICNNFFILLPLNYYQYIIYISFT